MKKTSYPIVASIGDAVETYGPLIRRYIGEYSFYALILFITSSFVKRLFLTFKK